MTVESKTESLVEGDKYCLTGASNVRNLPPTTHFLYYLDGLPLTTNTSDVQGVGTSRLCKKVSLGDNGFKLVAVRSSYPSTQPAHLSIEIREMTLVVKGMLWFGQDHHFCKISFLVWCTLAPRCVYVCIWMFVYLYVFAAAKIECL